MPETVVPDVEEAAERAVEAMKRLEDSLPKKHYDARGRRKPPERKRRRLEVRASRRANRGR